MAKMWEGRFTKELDKQADDFNSSLHFDCKMYKQDIKGSMAHATMLAAQKIISESDADIIISTLQSILDDIDSGALDFSAGGEDIQGLGARSEMGGERSDHGQGGLPAIVQGS